MELGLVGQVAFVAGSTQGIGEAIARAFLAEGCRVVISGRRRDRLDQVTRTLNQAHGEANVLPYCGDLTNVSEIEKAVRQTVARWGTIDCVVANIGSGAGRMTWDLQESDWQWAFEQNFWGSVRLVQTALPHMVKAKRGSVVFVSSIAGLEAIPCPLPYGTAKAALVNYCKRLSRAVGPDGVRVNCVAPGNVLFPEGTWDKKLKERREQVVDYIQQEVSLKRFGRPEEIADAVVFLCSERASFITGECLVVDGGQIRSL